MYLCFWVSLKTLLALFRQRMVEEFPVLTTRQLLFETDSKAPGAGTENILITFNNIEFKSGADACTNISINSPCGKYKPMTF